jgi:lipopolysaccharide export system protein LptC
MPDPKPIQRFRPSPYTRLIRWLKVLLPLSALILLSTLFLLSRPHDTEIDIPFAAALNKGEAAREQVTAPFYEGITPRGDTVSITAAWAQPTQDDGVLDIETLTARMRFAAGGVMNISANTAQIDDADQTMILRGEVEIDSSTGYLIQTSELHSALDRIAAHTTGPVTATGPAGSLQAGRLEIAPAQNGADMQLLFTDGVKLVYLPGNSQKAAQ